jgi:hypothetical protein
VVPRGLRIFRQDVTDVRLVSMNKNGGQVVHSVLALWGRVNRS